MLRRGGGERGSLQMGFGLGVFAGAATGFVLSLVVAFLFGDPANGVTVPFLLQGGVAVLAAFLSGSGVTIAMMNEVYANSEPMGTAVAAGSMAVLGALGVAFVTFGFVAEMRGLLPTA